MVTKEQIFELVDDIQDESVLEQVYDMLNYIKVSKENNIWSTLTEEQIQLVNKSYEQSKKTSMLVGHKEVKERLSKWL
ncbi:hypothetical protein [Arcticibacterium luteifluviistationis]|uniref:Uncharacterized protein n=1 Tax=Arcticibacterium luteifluviistationis TaxID=1784714 RepID=A0A2Z4G6Z1_9BACT|nr:hypothetical protein [Arcticibacterium luteifluviistationis]AWV96921.1 hypothetical protein DJ013_01500 [Arcticibacterium luteifluviistationis]